MSTLDRMRVMGVRSFSPERDELIRFATPLTLILGPNGTGKTTIIECLRYVTTGDSPPNSDRGQAFVHDPKLAGELEVKGKVQLKFADINHCVVTVTRMLEVTQKKIKLQVKSLDGSLVRQLLNGEKTTISSKCTELDREIPSMLGVSKAILNNVIFCHQEDSNWPLGDSKSLKDKFDDIFASSRFVKALDKLHNLAKEQNEQVKIVEVEIKHLGNIKIQAEKMEKELHLSEARLAVHRDRIQTLQTQLVPVQSALADIAEKEKNIFGVEKELTKKRTENSLEEKQCEDLEKQITEKFDGSIEELRKQKISFEEQLKIKKEDRDKTDSSLKKLDKSISYSKSKSDDTILELGQLKADAAAHNRNIENRDQLIRKYKSNHNIAGKISGEGILTTQEFDNVYSLFKNKLKNLEEETEQTKKEFAETEKKLQIELDDLNESKSRCSQTHRIRTKQIADNNAKIQTIRMKLKEIESSVEKLDLVEKDLVGKKLELKKVTGRLNEDQLGKEIELIQIKIDDLGKIISKLDDELNKLHAQACIMTELDVSRKNKKSKEDAIKKIKSKHDDTLIHLLGKVPTENVRSAIAQLTRKLKEEIRSNESESNKLKVQQATLETNRKTAKENLVKKEKELSNSEEEMFKCCGSRDLETLINQDETSIKNQQDEKGFFIGAQYLYNTFIDKLKRTDPCCPLCHRDFNEQQDVEELVNELNTKLTTMPTDLKNKQKSIEDLQQKCNKLKEMRSVRNQIEVFNEEIPALKAKVRELEVEIERCRAKLSDIEDTLMVKQSDIAAAEGMNDDLVLWETYAKEVLKFEKLIVEAERNLGPVGDKSADEVNEEKNDIKKQLEEFQTSVKEKQQILKEHTNMKNNLQKEVNQLESRKNSILSEAQKASELKNNKAQLETDIAKFQAEIEGIAEQLDPIEANLRRVSGKKEILIVNKEKTLEECKNRIQELKKNMDSVNSLHCEILMYDENDGPQKLLKCQTEAEQIQKVIAKDEEFKKVLEERKQGLSEEIDNHQTRFRNLCDCFTLKQKREQLLALKQEIKELQGKLGGFDVKTLSKEKSTLQKKSENFNAEISEERGKYKGLEESIRKQKIDLNADMFRNAEANYIKKLVDLTTTRTASSDLKKYYNALDGAIMQYHCMKMKEINKIIKDLWGKTYKGNDIDNIEIRSEAGDARGQTNRRQYNYKVVMIKGDVEQQMRGRCSAGQKVLASLIIRLSLAETFCLNCGIMALDEPTTNLDKENIDSLCDALAELVDSRSADRRFQLIVISHDVDFVTRLGRASSVEHYHLMEKDERGHSTIKRGSVQNSSLY